MGNTLVQSGCERYLAPSLLSDPRTVVTEDPLKFYMRRSAATLSDPRYIVDTKKGHGGSGIKWKFSPAEAEAERRASLPQERREEPMRLFPQEMGIDRIIVMGDYPGLFRLLDKSRMVRYDEMPIHVIGIGEYSRYRKVYAMETPREGSISQKDLEAREREAKERRPNPRPGLFGRIFRKAAAV